MVLHPPQSPVGHAEGQCRVVPALLGHRGIATADVGQGRPQIIGASICQGKVRAEKGQKREGADGCGPTHSRQAWTPPPEDEEVGHGEHPCHHHGRILPEG